MSEARQELLERLVGHVAENGMSDASLRELALAVGTSHRMLLYHFGSREGMVAAVVATVEASQRQVLQDLAENATTPEQLVADQWRVLCDPAVAPFVRLFFEVVAQAMFERPGTEGFLDSLTEPWLQAGTDAATRLDIEVDPDEIRLGVAVVRGLLLEAVTSGDVDASTRSLERFLAMWGASRS